MPSYYIDSSGGSDANAGTSRSAPFKTLAAAVAVLASGDKIYLKAGSEWKESLDVSGFTDILISYYGDLRGDGLPVIRGDDVLPNSWSGSSSRGDSNTNVYSQSFTVSGGSTNYLCFWEDDSRLTWVTDVATCQSTAGSWTLSTDASSGLAAGTYTLYIHPSSSDSPSTNGKTYEGTTRTFGINATGANSVIVGIWARRCAYNNGAIWTGTNSRIIGCLADGSLRHQMLAATGVMYQCVGWSEFTDPISTEIVLEFFQSVGDGSTSNYKECIVVCDQDQMQDAFGGHVSSGTEYSVANHIDCSTKNGKWGGGAASVVIDRPYMVNSTVEMIGASIVVTDPYVYITDEGLLPTSGSDAVFYGKTGSGDITVDGARIYIDSTDYGGGIFSTGGSSTGAFTVTRSTVADQCTLDEVNGVYRINISAGNSTVTFDGVVWEMRSGYTNNMYLMRHLSGAVLTPNLTLDNNVYWPDTVGARVQFPEAANNYANASAYLTAQQPTYDASSVVADPQITDPANGDFILAGAGLPASTGIERHQVHRSYMLDIPATLSAAEQWVINRLTRISSMNVLKQWRGAVEPASTSPSGNEIKLWRGAVEPSAPSINALIGGVTRSVTRTLTRGVTEGWGWGA